MQLVVEHSPVGWDALPLDLKHTIFGLVEERREDLLALSAVSTAWRRALLAMPNCPVAIFVRELRVRHKARARRLGRNRVTTSLLLLALVLLSVIGLALFFAPRPWSGVCPPGASPPDPALSAYRLGVTSSTEFAVAMSSAGQLSVAPLCAAGVFDSSGAALVSCNSLHAWPSTGASALAWNATYEMCELDSNGTLSRRCCRSFARLLFVAAVEHNKYCFDEYWTARQDAPKLYALDAAASTCSISVPNLSTQGGRVALNGGCTELSYTPPAGFLGRDTIPYTRHCIGQDAPCAARFHIEVVQVSELATPICEPLLSELVVVSTGNQAAVSTFDVSRNDRNSRLVPNPLTQQIFLTTERCGVALVICAVSVALVAFVWHLWLFESRRLPRGLNVCAQLSAFLMLLAGLVACCILIPATQALPGDRWECKGNYFVAPGIVAVLTSYILSSASVLVYCMRFIFRSPRHQTC